MHERSDFSRLLRFAREVGLFAAGTVAAWWIVTRPYRRALDVVGESLPPAQIAAASRGKPMLWLNGLLDSGSLKTETAACLCPDVTVFGSSRVMQLRAEMFRRVRPHGFYNLGGDMKSMVDAGINLRTLRSAHCRPKLILLGLDWWWFQADAPTPTGPTSRLLSIEQRRTLGRWKRETDRRTGRLLDEVQLVQRAWRDPRLWDALQRTPAERQRKGRRLVGMAAGTAGGFRNDGSFQYPPSHRPTSIEALRAEAFERFRAGVYRGNHVSEAAVADLERFLEECASDGIAVVAFLPPMERGVLDVFRAAPEAAGFWRDFAGRLAPVFTRHGVPFQDFTDPDVLGVSSAMFVDWVHGGERIYATILLRLAQDADAGRPLLPYVDAAALRQDLARREPSVTLYAE
jgi:hypothetical protein